MVSQGMGPHGTVFLIAVYRNSDPQNLLPLIELDTAQLGKMYSIGPIHFPPEILSLNRDTREEDEWYETFAYLRTHDFIKHDEGNVWGLGGPGWSYVDDLKRSDKNAPHGARLWDAVNQCLAELESAQAGQQQQPRVPTADDDVNRSTLRLLELCGEYRKQ